MDSQPRYNNVKEALVFSVSANAWQPRSPIWLTAMHKRVNAHRRILLQQNYNLDQALPKHYFASAPQLSNMLHCRHLWILQHKLTGWYQMRHTLTANLHRSQGGVAFQRLSKRAHRAMTNSIACNGVTCGNNILNQVQSVIGIHVLRYQAHDRRRQLM